MFIRKHHQHHGAHIALSQVVVAYHRDGGFEVIDTQGGRHNVSDFDWSLALETTLVATWPALPNTNLLDTMTEEDETEVLTRQTVIAWATYADGATRPVVTDPETMVHRSDSWAVEMPSGRVEGNSLEQWADADEWFNRTRS